MNNENNGKTKKIQLIVIIVVTAILIGVAGYIIGMRRGEEKSINNQSANATEAVTEKATEAETEASSEDKTEAASEEKTEAAEKSSDGDSKAEGGIFVTVNTNAPWQNEKGYGFQCDVKIQNDSSKEYKDWTVKISGFKGAEIENIWNAEYKLNGDILELTPVEYNNTIGSKTTVGDIGMIVDFKTEEECKNVPKGGELYVDGKLVAAADAAEKAREERKKERAEKSTPRPVESGTPYDNHGKLSVKGIDIVDKNGEKYQLRGVSTHGIAWFPQYVNKDAFQTLRDDWGANLVRIAMYTDEGGGYCTDGNQSELKKLVSEGVEAATELGMYVIVDWHILHDLTPLKYKDEAVDFFDEMSTKYADYDNIIYEICNEPNGSTTWDEVKEYADIVIPVIRKNDKDAIIIVGTPTWSQDVDIAVGNPLSDYDNIMYAVHFYAATHKENLREKAKKAMDAGLPVFISEFSICDASGNGGIDYDSADEWIDFINENNLSYASWSLSNKNETSALIAPDCDKTSGWSDDELSETGEWLKDTISSN